MAAETSRFRTWLRHETGGLRCFPVPADHLVVMLCENCGAPMCLSRDLGLMICDYCGGQATPPTDEDGVVVMDPATLACPVCSTALMNAALDSHPILYCTSCHGMLLDMEKFLPLLTALREFRYWSRSSLSPRDFDPARVLRCPRCTGVMDEHPYGGGGNVAVDSCETCGVLWLDRGELSRIVAAPDRDPVPVHPEAGPLKATS